MTNALTPANRPFGGLAPRGATALRPAAERVTETTPRDVTTPSQFSIPIRRPSRRQLPTKELVLVTTQLCILVKSGLDLAEALRSISRRARNPATRDALTLLWRDIESGRSFSEALKAQSNVFGATFAASVSAGEASGQLPDVLNRLKDLLRNELKLKNTVRSVLVYPAVLVVVGVLVMASMVFFVLPQFQKVYITMDRPAPLLTQLLLDVGSFCRGWWWLLLPSAALATAGLWRLMKTPAACRWRDGKVLSFRMTSTVVQNLVTGRAFVLMGTMMHSGVPLLEAMRLASSTVRNVLFHDLFRKVEDEVLAGRPMAPVLARSNCVPDGTSDLIATAESSGDLAGVLRTVGDFYQEEGEQRLRDLVKVLEPVIIIAMGVVVAGIVLSIMLPLIKLTTMGGH